MDERRRRAKVGRRAMVASLREQVATYFVNKGLPVHPRYPYILDRHANWQSNIMLERVARFIEQEIIRRNELNRHFALHSYIYHGLSSQALLWNLFGPLIVDGEWGLLAQILQKAGISLRGEVARAEWEVEELSVLAEHGGQPTSVDLCLHTAAGEQVFVEFKFTEANFGACSVYREGDCDGRNPAQEFDLCYLHHIGRQYWPLMQKHGLLIGNLLTDSQCPFTNLYQAFRLILYTLEKEGHFLLLYDARNPAFVTTDQQARQRGLFTRVLELLPEHARTRCHDLSVQEVMDVLEHNQLDWLPEIKKKHFESGKDEHAFWLP